MCSYSRLQKAPYQFLRDSFFDITDETLLFRSEFRRLFTNADFYISLFQQKFDISIPLLQ